MYSQRRLQTYNALLSEYVTEAVDIQDRNMMAARIMVEITESDLDYQQRENRGGCTGKQSEKGLEL